jgi:DNA-binding protein H-NS
MSVDALLKFRDEIGTQLRKKAEELQRQLHRLEAGRTRPRAAGKVLPKYRGPGGETWSGRGPRPRWLKSLLKQSHKLDEFAVDPPAASPKKRVAKASLRKRAAKASLRKRAAKASSRRRATTASSRKRAAKASSRKRAAKASSRKRANERSRKRQKGAPAPKSVPTGQLDPKPETGAAS